MTTSHRRGAAVEASALDATLALLAERGYGFSVDDVAERAGVHKTTVYRRWESKPVLVAAAIQRLAETAVPVEQTDDPLADLRRLALVVEHSLRTPRGRNALQATLAAAGSDPELALVARSFFLSRYAQAAPIIEKAKEHGVIRSEVDTTLLWQAIVNPLHMNAVCGVDTSDAHVHALVDLALAGAR